MESEYTNGTYDGGDDDLAIVDVKPWKENDLENLEADLAELPLIWDASFCGEAEQNNVDKQIRRLAMLSPSHDKKKTGHFQPKEDTDNKICHFQPTQSILPKCETEQCLRTPPRKKSKTVTFASPCFQTKSDSEDYYDNHIEDFKEWKPMFEIAHVESLALPVKDLFDKCDDIKIKSSIKASPLPPDLPILEKGDDFCGSPLRSRTRNCSENDSSTDSPERPPPVLSPQLPLTPSRIPTSQEDSGKKRIRPTGTNPDLDKYFVNPPKIISLEKFYYAEFPGNECTTDTSFKLLKCPICSKQFTSNVDIYGHIYNHIVAIGIRVSAIKSCPYCLDSFLPSDLKSHINTDHKMLKGETICCRICEVRFREKQELIIHVWENHCKQDMPYSCHICDYRSSFKYQVIDHFNKVHEGSANVLCVVCLKILPAGTDFHLKQISAHIQEHQANTGKKCSQCSLVFVGDSDWNGHLQDGAHTSKQILKDSRKVIKYADPTLKLIKMPYPPPQFLSDERRITRISNRADPQKKKVTLVRKKLTFLSKTRPITTPFPKLILNVTNETCMECGSSIKRLHHFPGRMMCGKCSFTTYCKTSMDRHDTGFHRAVVGPKKTRASEGTIQVTRSKVFDKHYFCSCGFKSINPNRLARHLALCDKITARPLDQ